MRTDYLIWKMSLRNLLNWNRKLSKAEPGGETERHEVKGAACAKALRLERDSRESAALGARRRGPGGR